MTAPTALAFLPFFTCLFWLVLAPLLSKKDHDLFRFEIMLFFIAASGLAHTVVNMSSHNTSKMVFFLIDQFATTSVIPLALSYVNRIGNFSNSNKPSLYFVWIVFPLSLIFADAILIMIAGKDAFLDYLTDFNNGFIYSTASDKVEQISYLCSEWVFNIILSVEAVVFITKTFFRSSERHIQSGNLLSLILIYALQVVLLTVFGTANLWISLTFPVLMSVSIFLIAYTGLFHNIRNLKYSDLLNGYNIMTAHVDSYDIETEDEPEPETTFTPSIANVHQNLIDEDRLRIRFEDLIITEQLFLKQGIRISDVAAKLNTNRTYVSKMVNNTYNMSFPDYINTLRIDYAEQYLLHHKDARQSDIAAACGFPNASSFNIIFKKITGVTPKIWLATNNQT